MLDTRIEQFLQNQVNRYGFGKLDLEPSADEIKVMKL